MLRKLRLRRKSCFLITETCITKGKLKINKRNSEPFSAILKGTCVQKWQPEIFSFSELRVPTGFQSSETVRCSTKYVFLKFLQSLQEKTPALESRFNSLQLCEIPAQMFSCKFCKYFKNTFFIEHLRTTASLSFKYKTWFLENNRS